MRSRANLWLLLAVVLCAASLWAGLRPDRGDDIDGGGPSATDTVHLLVLNGTDRGGLAREISLLLGPAGCVVEGVGNAPPDTWQTSLLVNRRLEPARAATLAGRLGGLPVVREWDERASEDAVLVLGADWARVREALAGPRRGENEAK